MAREVVVRMTDDFDRTQPADEVIEFGWEGYLYVLDLTAANAKDFRNLMQPYLDAAHEKVKQGKGAKPKSDTPPLAAIATATARQQASADRALRQKIRSWGRANGWEVGEKGVIPQDLDAAYRERVLNAKTAKTTAGKQAADD